MISRFQPFSFRLAMFTRRSFLLAGASALIGCNMPTRHLEIGDDGIARPGGPLGRIPLEPSRVILGMTPSKRGLIGQTVTTAAGKTTNLIDWQTDDDENALPVTILIGSPNGEALPNDVPYDFKAIISYGIGGAQNQIETDVFPGTVITLPASFVRVDIAAPAGTQPVRVSGLICRFPIEHGPAKRSLRSTGAIVPAGGELFAVPALARSFRVYITTAVPAGSTWELSGLDPGGVVFNQPYLANRNISDEIAIPNGMTSVQVANTSLNIIAAVVVFDLY